MSEDIKTQKNGWPEEIVLSWKYEDGVFSIENHVAMADIDPFCLMDSAAQNPQRFVRDDRIEALEAENARLRVRIKDITIAAERALNEWEGLIEDELVGEMYDACMKEVAIVRAAYRAKMEDDAKKEV